LSAKQRERRVADGEGGDELSRAGAVFSRGDTVQWKRRHKKRQGPSGGSSAVRTRGFSRSHRRAA